MAPSTTRAGTGIGVAKSFKDQLVSSRIQTDRENNLAESGFHGLVSNKGNLEGGVNLGGKNNRGYDKSSNPLFMSYDTSLKSNGGDSS